jgi:hypothetical protein
MTIRQPLKLPPHVRLYGLQEYGRRLEADPIGVRRLPDDRVALNALAENLCSRLDAARCEGIRGEQLVEELLLSGSRALRLLVAYVRVWGGVHQVVGLPGDRYYWGDHVPGLYERIERDCRRRARCYFYIASLHERKGSAMAAAQLVFDFCRQPSERGGGDDLTALIAAEGVKPEDVVSKFVEILAGTDEGRASLARLAEAHADVFLPESARSELLGHVDQLRLRIARLGRRAG